MATGAGINHVKGVGHDNHRSARAEESKAHSGGTPQERLRISAFNMAAVPVEILFQVYLAYTETQNTGVDRGQQCP